jgi:hypothetical protein
VFEELGTFWLLLFLGFEKSAGWVLMSFIGWK